ncbi:hypothetical protein KC19_1G296600 [Ceratodon purpureus]|uniref:Secreted protein n=1 Tax=Ceratodon purpureus TaxID=3225 RepID=A0A8T0JC05_CERPU|nr:hypothetical protein KC19_1G296600 [Ceratodon purpureus]
MQILNFCALLLNVIFLSHVVATVRFCLYASVGVAICGCRFTAPPSDTLQCAHCTSCLQGVRRNCSNNCRVPLSTL